MFIIMISIYSIYLWNKEKREENLEDLVDFKGRASPPPNNISSIDKKNFINR